MMEHDFTWWAWIVVLGGFGAAARYLLDTWLRARGRQPHIATLVINLIGSIAVGAMAGGIYRWYLANYAHVMSGGGSHVVANNPPDLSVVLLGLLGGFTTYSTAAVDAMKLWREGRYWAAVFATAGQLAICVVAAALAAAIAFIVPGLF